MSTKGTLTRNAILDHAVCMAARVGLEGLTLGRLAEELELSKSGLFAHFGSKETLQVQVLEAAAERFVDAVIKPALATPRGERRVRALFDRWVAWAGDRFASGGCLFVAAATELDDRPGVARDTLVRLQRDWFETIATMAKTGVTEGDFLPDTDPEQLASEIQGIMLAYHHAARLLQDPRAEDRARRAFERLLQSVHA